MFSKILIFVNRINTTSKVNYELKELSIHKEAFCYL